VPFEVGRRRIVFSADHATAPFWNGLRAPFRAEPRFGAFAVLVHLPNVTVAGRADRRSMNQLLLLLPLGSPAARVHLVGCPGSYTIGCRDSIKGNR
jgi:hypothetical protein